MVGPVSTRSLMIEPGVCPALGTACRVIEVSPLLGQLLLETTRLPREYELQGRDRLVIELVLEELALAPPVAMAVAFPISAALAHKCHAFLERPSPHDTISHWAGDLGMSRRSFTRRFRLETGMSFAEWRQQACLLIAFPRLALGESVTTIALDLGYDSVAAFTAMFKRRLGVPPSHYQA